MTKDIITNLSGIAGLQVLASNTAFAFKGKQIPALELAEQLNVDFVLEGSIRRHDGAVRMDARLVDAHTGYQRWADRYDRDAGDVFAVQDEMANGIVAALTIRLSPQEAQRLTSHTTESLAAYDHFPEGQRLSRVSIRETNLQAEQAYRKAISEDPGFGRAYGALSYVMAFRFRRGWTDTPVPTIDLALDLALKAVALDDAEWKIEEVKALSPNESISLLKATHPVKDAQAMQRLVRDLPIAGLPE